jgi:hypothetical protein
LIVYEIIDGSILELFKGDSSNARLKLSLALKEET